MKKNVETIKILLALCCYIVNWVFYLPGPYKAATYLSGFLLVGGPVLVRAVKNIAQGRVFDENFLMTIASLGAFALGEYPEGLAIMTFYQTGELFQFSGVEKSKKSIEELMTLKAEYANLIQNGDVIEVDPASLKPGDMILIKAGERIPVDGTITEGTSSLDISSLTGESVPKDIFPGDKVQSGCINISGTLHVRTDKIYAESTVSKILNLVENADSKKTKGERFITRFARYYTPSVVALAIALTVLPLIFIPGSPFTLWAHRSLTFLVISCPCALVLSIPLSFFGGIGGASRQGILIKGSNFLEVLSRTKIAVFDKTGTLTEGTFFITEIFSVTSNDNHLLELAAYAECDSSHPLAKAILKKHKKGIDRSRIDTIKELPGYGIKARIDGETVLAGNDKMMKRFKITGYRPKPVETIVHLAKGTEYLGCICLSDKIRKKAKETVSELRRLGIENTVMLTGDTPYAAKRIADEIGLDHFQSGLLPEGKVEALEKLLKNVPHSGKLLYIGDGINDAPVLARADVGIAMGGLGSDAAIEAADIVIMDDHIEKLALAIRLSKKTMSIVRQNIVFILSVKALIMVLGAFGVAGIWAAVFADVGVSIIAILNSLRSLVIRPNRY